MSQKKVREFGTSSVSALFNATVTLENDEREKRKERRNQKSVIIAVWFFLFIIKYEELLEPYETYGGQSEGRKFQVLSN